MVHYWTDKKMIGAYPSSTNLSPVSEECGSNRSRPYWTSIPNATQQSNSQARLPGFYLTLGRVGNRSGLIPTIKSSDDKLSDHNLGTDQAVEGAGSGTGSLLLL